MIATTKLEATGVPIHQVRFNHLHDREESLKDNLISTLGARYGVYDAAGSFHENLLAQYLSRRGWSWPLLESGRLDLKDQTFKAMAAIHPELEPLRQLRYTLDKLKLNQLCVSRDGFNRCWLNPFGSRTSRNQPSDTKGSFSALLVVNAIHLIEAEEGYGANKH